MTVVSLFLTATKLVGAFVTLTVAANAFSFSRFRNKNLRPFRSPIDESSDTLAVFDITGNDSQIPFSAMSFNCTTETVLRFIWLIAIKFRYLNCLYACCCLEDKVYCFYFILLICLFAFAEGENGFFFGLATAPAHVEDRLDDAWIQFAEQESGGAESKQEADALMGAAGDGGSHQAVSSPQHASSSSRVKKGKKPLKVAMEAMIRGFEKYMEVEGQEGGEEEEQHPKVTAWHNVPHP